MGAIEGSHVGAPGLVHAEAIPVHPPCLHIHGQVGSICHTICHNPRRRPYATLQWGDLQLPGGVQIAQQATEYCPAVLGCVQV